MERERKGIIWWMVLISICLIVSLIFNVLVWRIVKPPIAPPQTEIIK